MWQAIWNNEIKCEEIKCEEMDNIGEIIVKDPIRRKVAIKIGGIIWLIPKESATWQIWRMRNG
jgi:hypothetical protein